MKSRFVIAVFIIIQISCISNENKSGDEIMANSTWEFLSNESIKFRKPNNLKRSSRFRLKEDMPALANHPTKLLIFQNSLNEMEFSDSQIDVFVDTTTNFRIVIICNVDRIPFQKSDAIMLKQSIRNQLYKVENKTPNVTFSELQGKINATKTSIMASYSTKVIDMVENTYLNFSNHYLTGNAFTLVVYEYSDSDEGIEKYLWTTRI